MARFIIATLGVPTHVTAVLAAEYTAYLTDSAATDEALIAAPPPPAGAGAAAAYYDRSVALAAPRWSGGGLGRLSLKAGDPVNTEDLAVMLAGRLPATGERLLSASGSHGRVHLAAGRPTLEPAGGEALYDARDAQARCRLRSARRLLNASTLSDADLRALIEAVESSGAVLRTLGDPAQHTSVAAASMWTHLVDRYGTHTPELTEHRRLQDAREAEAADLARQGRVQDAFERLRSAGQLSEAEGASAYTVAVDRWMRLRKDNKGVPIVTRDNATRRTLNELCQRLLLDAGDIAVPVSYGGIRLGEGDEVLARRTDRLLTAGPPAATSAMAPEAESSQPVPSPPPWTSKASGPSSCRRRGWRAGERSSPTR